uniref:ZP domain-containing protein n=1 Tax=Steinernema glaseri TaxID=37863 RepID=A0A1I7ZHB5_9BILA
MHHLEQHRPTSKVAAHDSLHCVPLSREHFLTTFLATFVLVTSSGSHPLQVMDIYCDHAVLNLDSQSISRSSKLRIHNRRDHPKGYKVQKKLISNGQTCNE